jgi:hypothetical protein
MTYSYPMQLNIQYSTDQEYRKCLRDVFQMDSTQFPDVKDMDLDQVTADEMMYDEKAASRTMEHVFENTFQHKDFILLYEKAASFMFSIDTNIGLTILFGYDYLDLFHPLLSGFFSNMDNKTLSSMSEYKLLYDKLHK